MCRGKKKSPHCLHSLYWATSFCSSSIDWGMSVPIPKKQSPPYIVKTSHRLYILTVCLIDMQVCKEEVLL